MIRSLLKKQFAACKVAPGPVVIMGLLLLLVPLAAAAGQSDKEIVFYTGSGVARDYDKGDTDYYASFGQYDLSGTSCCGIGGSAEYRRFLGIPGGEIVGRWRVTYLDPFKKDKPYDEQVVKIRYFYVHSKPPIRVPPRHPNHWVYEVYVAFGPREVSAAGLHPRDKPGAKPLDDGRDGKVYSVGELDTLYYFIRSRPKDVKSSQWPRVNTFPAHFTAVRGMEITREQYRTIACETGGKKAWGKYLQKKRPD